MPLSYRFHFDWDEQPNKPRFADHWRVYLGLWMGVVLTTLLLHVVCPSTFWFEKLWSGTAIGVAVGTVAALPWQLKNDNRRKCTSGHLIYMLIGVGVVGAGIALCREVPGIVFQEATLKSIRGLADQDVKSVSIQEKVGKPFQIDHQDEIAGFATLMKRATLFYPSHEGTVGKLEITIHFQNGASTTYAARIAEKHQSDISLELKGPSGYFEVLIPEGRTWYQAAMTKPND